MSRYVLIKTAHANDARNKDATEIQLVLMANYCISQLVRAV